MMALELNRVKSKYTIYYRNKIGSEIIGGIEYFHYEEVDTTVGIIPTVKFIAKFIDDSVEKIHFTDIEQHGYRVSFTIRFLDDNWRMSKFIEIKINTDAKYGYSFLASALREKFPNIVVCAKKLNN